MSAANAKYLQPKYYVSGMFYVYLLNCIMDKKTTTIIHDEPTEIKGALLC